VCDVVEPGAFGLDERERRALRDGSPGAMGGVGVHPILQIQYLLATDPAMRSRLSVTAYLDRIKRG